MLWNKKQFSVQLEYSLIIDVYYFKKNNRMVFYCFVRATVDQIVHEV